MAKLERSIVHMYFAVYPLANLRDVSVHTKGFK